MNPDDLLHSEQLKEILSNEDIPAIGETADRSILLIAVAQKVSGEWFCKLRRFETISDSTQRAFVELFPQGKHAGMNPTLNGCFKFNPCNLVLDVAGMLQERVVIGTQYSCIVILLSSDR